MLSFDLNLVAFVLFESLTLNLVFSSVHRLISPFNTKSRLLYFHIKIKIIPNWKEKCFWNGLEWSISHIHFHKVNVFQNLQISRLEIAK